MTEARACPILPVTDLDRALAHYAALGCRVSRHDDTYGFAALAGVELHLSVVADHDPLRTAAAVFLHVPDADDLARRWADVPRTGAGGHRLRHPGGLAHRPGRQPAPLRVAVTVGGVTTTTRWGIVGPGRIAENVVRDVVHVPGAEVTAVGSRSPDRAQDFARRHGIGTAHGSYADLVADPDVDVLYLATPHPQHHAVALDAIAAGKHLLVEKSFTATVAGAQEVVDAARAAGVFVMEAMWTRFQPAVVRLRELVADGAVGEVRSVQADLGVAREYDPADRLFAKELGGGALLDLGVYVVSFAQMLLGDPDTVTATGSTFPTGVDAEAAVLLGYADGRAATLLTSLRNALPGRRGCSAPRAGSTSCPGSTTRPRSCCTGPVPSPRPSPSRRTAPGTATSWPRCTRACWPAARSPRSCRWPTPWRSCGCWRRPPASSVSPSRRPPAGRDQDCGCSTGVAGSPSAAAASGSTSWSSR